MTFKSLQFWERKKKKKRKRKKAHHRTLLNFNGQPYGQSLNDGIQSVLGGCLRAAG